MIRARREEPTILSKDEKIISIWGKWVGNKSKILRKFFEFKRPGMVRSDPPNFDVTTELN